MKKIKSNKKISPAKPTLLLTSLISCGLIGCTNSSIDILFRDGNNKQPSPPDIYNADDIYLPLSDKMSTATSTTGNDTSLLYNSAVINNTHYISYGTDSGDQPSDITLPTSIENHFVTIPHLVHYGININLGDGDDTVYFESNGITNPSEVLIDLGNGKNRLVLKGALIEASKINLGTGQSKIYLSPLKNFSSISLDKNLHKIVLTEGMVFNDLEFSEDSNFLIINLKPRKDHEFYSVPLLKITKNSGGLNSLSDINDSSFFEVAEVIDKKYGVFYPTTKYSKKPVLLNLATNPISYQVNQYVSAPDRPNTYEDFFTTTTIYNFTDLFGKTISSNYFVNTLSSPSTPITVDSDYLPLYQIADPLLPDDYVVNYVDLATLATKDKYLSMEFDNRIFTKGPGRIEFYNPSHFIFKAYPHHHNDLYFNYPSPFPGSSLLNTYIDLNGKQTGHIYVNHSNIFLHIFLSRQGSAATFTVQEKYRLRFYLGDNIKLSDLILSDKDNLIEVKIKDDTNTEITIVKLDYQNTPGLNLAELNSNLSSYFLEDPVTIDELFKLPVFLEL